MAEGSGQNRERDEFSGRERNQADMTPMSPRTVS